MRLRRTAPVRQSAEWFRQAEVEPRTSVLWYGGMASTTAQGNDAVRPLASVCHADKRVAIRSIFLFWAFYFVLNTTHMAIAGEPDQIEMACRRAAVLMIGITL